MAKEEIALDIDDLLLNTTDAVRRYVNVQVGIDLTQADYRAPGAYWGYYERVWAKAGVEDIGYNAEFHKELAKGNIEVVPVQGAVDGVAALAERYSLRAITSRPSSLSAITSMCVNEYFSGQFTSIVYLGHAATASQTKGEICEVMGASWLVDDNVDHCRSTVGRATSAVLFGQYGWHLDVPGWLEHREDWPALVEFFGER